MSQQEAEQRNWDHARIVKISRETEAKGWPPTPKNFRIPPYDNAPNRIDLGYWARQKQPTPIWVDLPHAVTQPPPGAPGPSGIPETGSSVVRWGAPVVRKLPEALLLQIARLRSLVAKVRGQHRRGHLQPLLRLRHGCLPPWHTPRLKVAKPLRHRRQCRSGCPQTGPQSWDSASALQRVC